ALMEVGPFRVKSEDKIVANDGSWHKYANLLFVDQPKGVGFSTSDTDSYVQTLDEMADDLLKFFDEYFEIFPEQLNGDFYIAGESFAGQYIPYFARAILNRNKKLKEENNRDGKEKHVN